ncbi:hypothetical protein M885DRAFT_617254 [Pelagophyceae sp. CCMP2097]|nr:hypothetical protein M885DRAFT_617254 [Pelagophyceae sp. CCMP2097]
MTAAAALDSDVFVVVAEFCGGEAVRACACAAKALRPRAYEAAEAQVRGRFAWLARAAAAPPPAYTWPALLVALEAGDGMLLVGGTRDESDPVGADMCVVAFGAAVSVTAAERPRDYRPPPRVNAATVARGRGWADVYVVGGWNGERASDRVAKYDGATWTSLGSALVRRRCFCAAAVAPWAARDRLVVAGGGDSLFLGGNATADVEVLTLKGGAKPRAKSAPGPALLQKRCGHGLVATSDALLAAGGYAGGTTFLASAETLSGDGRWVEVAPMRERRSGSGFGFGPDHCVYAAGGSPDGLDATDSAEKFDSRCGRWLELPPMRTRRSYVAAGFCSKGDFVVHGGYDEIGAALDSAECFDVRANQWRTIEPRNPVVDVYDRVPRQTDPDDAGHDGPPLIEFMEDEMEINDDSDVDDENIYEPGNGYEDGNDYEDIDEDDEDDGFLRRAQHMLIWTL